MYNSFADVEKICRERGWTPAHLFLENEKKLTGRSEEEILRALDERLRVMEDAAARALKSPLHAVGGLIDGVAEKQWRYAAGETLCGGFLNRVMARAYSCSEVNASMGRICAAPTAGSCGILPAVLLTMQEARCLSRSEVIDALLTASGFGAVVMKNATVAGAEGGCQAECGVAAAMAAAAAVQLCGGTLPQMLSAFSHALSACMGLVCDPVAGLVQVPCAQRNASQAVSALVSADQALAGQVFPIPADQVVGAMYRVGRQLPPELKETAQGGIAATDRGKEIAREIHKGA